MVIPLAIELEIQAMPRACVADEEDRLIWAATSNGVFNLNSAYLLASNQIDHQISFNGKWIWKFKVLPRIQSFIWLCSYNSLAIQECLASRGIPISTICLICLLDSESILHLLRDCGFASNCWQNLGLGELSLDFFSLNTSTWLEKNCKLEKRTGYL